MVVYALLGTSRPLSMSTTTTIAILAAAALGETAADGGPGQLLVAGATLAIQVGAMLVLASVLRLGFVANFISDPVLTGFKSGIGLVIVADQVPKLLGIHIDKTGFFRDILAIVEHLPETSPATLVVALVLFALILGVERFLPRVPAPLIAVAVAIAASALLDLPGMGVAAVGSVPSGLPELVRPNLDLVEAMWPAAAGIALMSFTESIAAARTFRDPGEPRPLPNRELLAVGLANAAGGFLGAMAAGGGTTQTAVNRKAGARTQVAELVTAAAAVATMLLLAPLIALMPQAALAVVVVAYSVDLIRPAEFTEILRVRRIEFYWAVVAFAGVVLLGTLQGILVAVIVSLLALAEQLCHPHVYVLGRSRDTRVFRPVSAEHPDDMTWPGLLIVRIEGPLFFANAQWVGDNIRPLAEQAEPAVLLLDFSAVLDLEYTALKMLVETAENVRREGIQLWLAGLNPSVREVADRSALGKVLGRERIFDNRAAAIARYEAIGAAG
jgi:high affinity sulfate transporter 1